LSEPALFTAAQAGLETAGIVFLIVLSLVNLAGAIVCRINRIAGGIMMLLTALLLTLLFIAACLLISAVEFTLTYILFLMPVQALSIIGAIIALVSPGENVSIYPSLYSPDSASQPQDNAFVTRYASAHDKSQNTNE